MSCIDSLIDVTTHYGSLMSMTSSARKELIHLANIYLFGLTNGCTVKLYKLIYLIRTCTLTPKIIKSTFFQTRIDRK